jgi:GT2 family glycosyltransferase
MKSVGVLVSNYQSWPLTERAIREVLRWSGDAISKIVVVDNASDAPALFPNTDKVVIHRNIQNLGYVRSVNIGMHLLDDDVVLFLDCDAYPLMDLIPQIFQHFQNEPRLGALGFFEFNAEGKTRIAGDHEPTLISFLLGQALGARCARHGWFLGKRFVLHSCCMAVRREAFHQICGFDETFDFLDADTDFSLRLLDAGWLIKTDSALKCFHQGSGSPMTTSGRVLRLHRNRWLLLRKHRRVRFGSVCKLMLFIRHLIELLFKLACAPFQKKRAGRLADFVHGRINLLRTVWWNYR